MSISLITSHSSRLHGMSLESAVFMEMWLSNRVPDASIQLDGLTSFRTGKNAAVSHVAPTDWHIFMVTETDGDSV